MSSGKTDEEADAEAQEDARKAQDEAAAAAAAESDASPGEVSIHVNDARRRWAKARGFFQAYAALTAPLLKPSRSREIARGQSLPWNTETSNKTTSGSESAVESTRDVRADRQRKSSAYRIAPPGSEM